VRRPNTPVGMRFRGAASLFVLLALLAGCGGDDNETAPTTTEETVTETGTSSTPTQPPQVAVRVYFLRDGKVAPVQRDVTGPAVGSAAVRELLEGPMPHDPGVESAVPDGTELESLSISSGVATVQLSEQPSDDAARAQLVYTLTQFPTVKRVDLGTDRPVGRRAFESETPAILVESPLPDESVESGFAVRGTANTFEATFNYELKDASGKVLRKNFVTATSGSGTRGTFAFRVPYTVDKPQQGRLVVFELSAEDGSRINESEIPLRLQ
jgi:Immunoglobulin-like domain of bacterial spore germination/Sporulation and spore germination